MIESHLSSTVEDFGTRAELCAFAAELAASYAANEEASDWVRQCWSNLLAYGYHKDMLLDQCLHAIDSLQKAGFRGDSVDLLVRLAPAVSAVGDYTDGDETNHFPRHMGRLLLEASFHGFVKYHEWLSARNEYWDALSIFDNFVANADLGNRVFRAVAETAVERENLLALARRAEKGDQSATECLRRLSLFPVPAGDDPEKFMEDQRGSEPMLNVGDFPPDKFEAYLEEVQTTGRYRVDEDIDAWARFWSAPRYKKAVLAALKAFDSSRPYSSGEGSPDFPWKVAALA